MGAAVLKSPKGSCIRLTVQYMITKLIAKFPDKQHSSVDRWLSFGGITIITNEPGPGIELHFARLNLEIIVHRKGERE